MPYIPLNSPRDLQGTKVGSLIDKCIDPVLEDIREMMCMAIRSGQGIEGPPRQLQYPIASLLVNVISGCADSLMVKPAELKDNKRIFIKYLKEYACPFQGDFNLSGGPETLYKYFRSPLIHRFGVPYDNLIFIPRVIMRFPGQSYSELDFQLSEIEQSNEHPYGKNPVFVADLQRSDSITLLVESLYWVTRKSIENWSRDKDQVRKRENLL